jgi:penicillin-insensitive murein endopeptidase
MRARLLLSLCLFLPLPFSAAGADDVLPWVGGSEAPHKSAAPAATAPKAAKPAPAATPAAAKPAVPPPAPPTAPSTAEAVPAATPVAEAATVSSATAAPAPAPAGAAQQKPVQATGALGLATPATAAAAPAPPAAAGASPPTATTAAAKPADTAKAAKPDPVPAKKLFGAAKVAARMTPRAIGSYAKGCLAGAEALPIDGPAWQAMRLSRNRNWAHPKLVALVERFATEMKAEGWPGLLVGDLSQPRGGPMLSGHKSHQLGLDADIWFKPMPPSTLSREEREKAQPLLLANENGTEVIKDNWNDGFARLVKHAASYPEVERIFVHPAIKKKLCEVAGTDRAWLGKVRPLYGHNYHFHVRISCPNGSGGCEKQKPITGEDGCGKEVEDWIKLVSRPSKAAPATPAPKPAKPPEPEPVLTLEKLPPACREVLAAAPDGITPPPPVTVVHKGAAKPASKKTAEKQ